MGGGDVTGAHERRWLEEAGDHPTQHHDRPLAPRGRRATKLIAEHLGRRGVKPALALCSSSRRTRQTLDGIAPVLGKGVSVQIERELYAASEQRLLIRLQAVEDSVESLMVIGHNPGVEQLALSLAAGGHKPAVLGRKYPTGALAMLEFRGRWSELRPGCAELTDFVTPKQLAKR